MGPTELQRRAKLFILPRRSGETTPLLPEEYDTAREAIRFVMEALTHDQRQCAVIAISGRLLFYPEIEAVFETRMLDCAARVA